MEIKIKVFTGAAKAKVIEEKGRLLVYVKSEKTRNLANMEARLQVSKFLKIDINSIKIKRGQRSENKILEVM